MDVIYHFPFGIIIKMLLWENFHQFKKFKETFKAFVISQCFAFAQQYENISKLNELFLCFEITPN
jgi:hypothetical protein